MEKKVSCVENESVFSKDNRDYLKANIEAHKIGFLNSDFSEQDILQNVSFSNEEVLDQDISLPIQYYTYVSPIKIETLLQPLMADEVAPDVERTGGFGDKAVAINRVEYTGEVENSSLWGDMYNVRNVGVKYSYIKRGIYYGAISKELNSLKASMLARAKRDYNGDLDEALRRAMAIFQNKSFFFGIGSQMSENPIFGYLNDPNVLPEYVATGSGGSKKWSAKTSLEVSEDLNSAYADLVEQLNGKMESLIREGGYLQLTIGPRHSAELTKPNIYRDGQAMSMIELIGKQLGKEIKIVVVPEMDGNIDNEDAFVLELIVPKLKSLTRLNSVEAMFLPTFIKSANTYNEVIVSTGGQVLRYPEFRVIRMGI